MKNKTSIEVVVRIPVHVRNMQEKINTIYDILNRPSQPQAPAEKPCSKLGVAV